MMNAGDMMIGDSLGSKGKGKKSFQHPTYVHLIHDAINTLRQRGGSSGIAIRKSIEQKMGPTLGPNYRKIVGSTLSKLAKTGKLIKIGNTFKLSPEFKKDLKRRQRHSKKTGAGHKRRHRRKRHRRRRHKRGFRIHRRRLRIRGYRKTRSRRSKVKVAKRRRRRRRSVSPRRHKRSRTSKGVRVRHRRRHTSPRRRRSVDSKLSPSKQVVQELND